MSDILEIREKLDDTNAAIARLHRSVAENPDLLSLHLTEQSLRKRQRQLEAEFTDAADHLNLDVCDYRLIPDKNDVSIFGIATALSDFQDMFSVFFDATRSGVPKITAHIGAESAAMSTLNFAYTFPGSIGIALTASKNSELFVGDTFEKTIGKIQDVAKAQTPEQILRHARKLGPAPIRSFYKWAKGQLKFELGTEIKWKRGRGVRRELLVQPPELRHLSEIIDRTSDDVSTNISVAGELTMADIGGKRFKMTIEPGQEISGTFDDAISAQHQATLPRRYAATLGVTTRTKFSTEQNQVDYFLEDLREL